MSGAPALPLTSSGPSTVHPLRAAATDPLADRSEAPRPRLVSPEALSQPRTSRADGVARVPLYHRSGSVALLDDDPDFVEMLAASLPKGWKVDTFLSPNSCLNHLQQQPPKWEADFWAQQELVAQWRTGMPLLPLILKYWASHPARTELTKVLVLDYLMPGRDGLDTLRDLADWPGHRVLLTGAFDETLAVDAFNAGLIDQFIVKQQPQLRDTLVGVVESLLARPNPRHHQIWSATLAPPQLVLLQQREVADELCTFLRRTFVEWVVLGEPFGALGLDARGAVQWLQLEPGRNLKDLAELAREAGADAGAVAAIRAGRMLTNLELRRNLGLRGGDLLPARQVGPEPGVLFAATTRIELKSALQAANPLRRRFADSGNEHSF